MMQKNNPFSKERLLEALQQFPRAGVYWVGFSGGADSTALLHALSELLPLPDSRIRVLHVNHGLQPESDSWQLHCENICAALGLEILARKADIDRGSGSGLEAEARHARYSIVEDILGSNEIFLTGHHLDDQAETLLLNLVRGSGVDGLAGMPAYRPLGKGFLARPLLNHSMQALRQYLATHKLTWLEDPSNLDQSYDRNFVRQSLLPMFEGRWPGAAERMARSTEHCRAASLALTNWAAEGLSECLPHPQVLDLSQLQCEFEQTGFLIRHWLRSNQALPLPARRLEQLLQQLSHAVSGNKVCIEWSGWVIHLFRNCLWLQTRASIASCPKIEWDGTELLSLDQNIGTLEIMPGLAFQKPVEIDQRRGGEKIQLAQAMSRRKVKDLLRELHIPPWLRESIPILHSQGRVLAIADCAVSVELRQLMAKTGSRLSWQPLDPLLSFVHQQCLTQAVDRN